MTFEEWKVRGSWLNLTAVDLATAPVKVAKCAWDDATEIATRAERERICDLIRVSPPLMGRLALIDAIEEAEA